MCDHVVVLISGIKSVCESPAYRLLIDVLAKIFLDKLLFWVVTGGRDLTAPISQRENILL